MVVELAVFFYGFGVVLVVFGLLVDSEDSFLEVGVEFGELAGSVGGGEFSG